MQHQSVRPAIWHWVFCDPVSGRTRTDGCMTEPEAAPYPGAMHNLELGHRPRRPVERNDFEDTQAGSFHATGAHVD